MKSTGIVRGIDSLGRIVLPKELRTTLHLDGDTKLEIFVDGTPSCSRSTAPSAAATSAAMWTPTPSSLPGTASAPPAAARSARCKPESKGGLRP